MPKLRDHILCKCDQNTTLLKWKIKPKKVVELRQENNILSPTEEGGVLGGVGLKYNDLRRVVVETNSRKYSDLSVGLGLSTPKFEEYLGIWGST